MRSPRKNLRWDSDGTCQPSPGIDIWCGSIPGDPEQRAFCVIDVCDEREVAVRTHSWVARSVADGRLFCADAYLRLKINRPTLVSNSEAAE
jgi:hypothetical protein